VYVRTRQEAVLELQVRASDAVSTVKDLIAEREGTPRESQRLLMGGINMQDSQSLASYGVRHGASLLLAAQLPSAVRSVPRTFAPRGILMVPGSKTWQPKAAESRPYLPVLCSDVSRPFPVSLEFTSAPDAEAFMNAVNGGDEAVLEIQPSKAYQPALETRVHYDVDTGAVHLESSGHALEASTEYKAFLHYGGRGGHTNVIVATGAATA